MKPHKPSLIHPDSPRTTQAARRHRLLFLAMFLCLGAILGGLIMVIYDSETDSYRSRINILEQTSIALRTQNLAHIMGDLESDLRYLANHQSLQKALNEDSKASLESFARDLKNFALSKRIYDQLRFLDTTGKELVRVNYNNGMPQKIPDSELQFKGKRYYFTDAIPLDRGEVFVSPLDLNVEHGKVERPLKPMIRLATPVFDDFGTKRGILLLNYLAKTLLAQAREGDARAPGKVMIVNNDGYWLLSPDPEDEWGFMLEDRKNRRFSVQFPEAWKNMNALSSGQIETKDGMFTFDTIHPLAKGQRSSTGSPAPYSPSLQNLSQKDYSWKVITFVPDATLREFTSSLRMQMFILGAILFLLAATVSWFASMTIIRRRVYQEKLYNMAHFDNLTGLPNRTLFFDRIGHTHETAVRYTRNYGLLYVDVDNFKKINDTLGHNAGDELLIQVASRLKESVRKSDTVARLGGDEFAVILSQIEAKTGAEAVARKALKIMAEPFQLGKTRVSISVSIGISLYPQDGSSVEEMLRKSDLAMYRSKNTGKGTYNFSKES